MTRENKLALVVGFGLILFVGILISDHFSVARTQASANLMNRRIDDPLVLQPRDEPDLIAVKPEPESMRLAPGEPAMNTGRIAPPSANEPMSPEQRTIVDRTFAMSQGTQRNTVPRDVQPVDLSANRNGRASASGTQQQVVDIPGFVPVEEGPAINLKDVRFHDVRTGESMYAICKQYYGDTTLVVSLAKFNKMNDPAALREGRRLMIPPAEAIGGKPKASPSPTPALRPTAVASSGNTPKPQQPKTYTVKPGDSLAGIARRLLGSEERWRELHKLNKSVIDDPDNIRAGIVLKLG